MVDFKLDKYLTLVKAISENYDVHTVRDYLLKKPKSNFVILRHDIDRFPKNALKMAELENTFGIVSTYYFRYPHTFKPNIIKKIHDLRHEIGYHYEVLSKTKGDYEKAIKLFEYELNEFRKVCNVETICMHGSPLSKYNNRDLWKRYDFKEFGIAGEAYSSVDKDIFYLTDTGRNWNNKYNLKDKYIWKTLDRELKNTDELIGVLREKTLPKLYITTHPERWGYNSMNWIIGYLRDFVFNTGKKVLGMVRG